MNGGFDWGGNFEEYFGELFRRELCELPRMIYTSGQSFALLRPILVLLRVYFRKYFPIFTEDVTNCIANGGKRVSQRGARGESVGFLWVCSEGVWAKRLVYTGLCRL